MALSSEQGLTDELGGKIRAEIGAQVARWVVAALGGLLVAAALGWWFYLSPIIQSAIGAPPGMVAAFDLRGSCPDGWKAVEDAVGRTIVGAAVPNVNNLDQAGQRLVAPPFRQNGGHVSIALTRANLPAMPLEIDWRFSKVGLTGGGGQIIRQLGDESTEDDGDGGRRLVFELGGQAAPIGNLTPYLALAICRRD